MKHLEPARPPGPPPPRRLWDELLRLRDLQQDVLGTFAQRFAYYGDTIYVRLRNAELYATCHPDVIHEVLVTQAEAFGKRTLDLELLGQGLLTSDGEAWRRQRRRIQPGFRHDNILRYGELIAEETERMLGGWVGKSQVELRGEMMQLTLRIVCRALFGQTFRGSSRRISRAMHVLQEAPLKPKFLPPWLPTPGKVSKERMMATINQEVFAIIDDAESAPGSLLASLKTLVDDEGRMTRDQLRDEVVTLLIAGHETTALALTWALYLVSVHPEVGERLVEEVDRVTDNRRLDAGCFSKLDYTKCVINEAMRLYPPAYVIPRVTNRWVTVGGYRIPPRTELWLWVYFVHRDPRWFSEPDRFRPDRFGPGGDALEHPHCFFPFGAGMRTCVGRHFAMLEAVLALAAVVRRYRLTLLDGRPLRPRPRITLAPARRVPVRLSPR